MADDRVEPSFAPQPRSSVVAVPVADELVLFDEDSGVLVALDAKAAVLWQCLDGDVTIADLAAEVADAFEAPVATVESDLLALVRMLESHGLLDGVDVPGDGDLAEPDDRDRSVPVLTDPPDP